MYTYAPYSHMQLEDQSYSHTFQDLSLLTTRKQSQVW